jgi:hypothetical protein
LQGGDPYQKKEHQEGPKQRSKLLRKCKRNKTPLMKKKPLMKWEKTPFMSK